MTWQKIFSDGSRFSFKGFQNYDRLEFIESLTTAWAEGIPNLLPEKGILGEVGLERYLGLKVSIKITYFRNDLDNLIDWAAGSDGIWRPYNVGSAITEGLELETKGHLTKYAGLGLNYTYLRAKDEKMDRYLT